MAGLPGSVGARCAIERETVGASVAYLGVTVACGARAAHADVLARLSNGQQQSLSDLDIAQEHLH